MTSPTAPLLSLLPAPSTADPDQILSRFLDFVAASKLELYPAQEEALLEMMTGKNIILNTPTGSGKSLVATGMHFKAMAEGKRSFYTSPIKALASEKFFALCQLFGADNVGMLTGDAGINPDAPVICCTAEILANIALRQGGRARVDYAILDEFHYYADRERGAAWEIPLLALPQSVFLLMSATLGDTRFFEAALTKLNGRGTSLVRSEQRPVPLDYEYRETPLHETIDDLVAQGRYPIYVVSFTQRACAEEAQNLMSTNFSSREDKQAIGEALRGVKFDSPYGKEVQKFLRHGIGIHHAGLLPKYRLQVEKLSQRGLLKVICGTDTLGVGVNIPIRTVLFTRLCKYDGEKTAVLSVRDFKQICGRAGRKGFDVQGSVVAQAPEHVVENLRMEQKAAGDPAKLKKTVRKKPPEKGYVHWDRQTFDRLVAKPPEELSSRFTVSHGMLLNLMQDPEPGPGGGYGRLIALIAASHVDPGRKRAHRQLAKLLFRSLVDAGVLALSPSASGRGSVVHLVEGLQREFSLHQTLSLYLLDTLDRLDPEDPEYGLNLVTLVESILEDPDVVLLKQLDRIKTEKLDALKAEGVQYEERMAELEKLEYPKPLREYVYETFNAFAKKHPWVGQENIRPKSVAREMFERYSTFDEYIRDYNLHRSEGLLLRYLSDAYKALVQTVPDRYKSTDVLDVIAFLRATVRHADSSLVDEWEGLQGDRPGVVAREQATPGERARELWREPRAVAARIRGEMHRLLKLLAARNWEGAAELVTHDESPDWTAAQFEEAMAPYYREYDTVVMDQEARSAKYTRISDAGSGAWNVLQTIADPNGDLAWAVEATVAFGSEPQAESVTRIQRIGAE